MSDKDIKPIDAQDDDLPDVDYDKIVYGASVSRVNKGDELDLMEVDPTLVNCMIGMGWDLKNFEQLPLDLDSSVFLLNKDEMTRENEDFIFYNNPHDKVGAIKHDGDSRTGAGDGDDETVTIKLTKLSFDVIKIVFVISIYDDELVGHSFKDVRNVYFRFVNIDSDHELFRFELDDMEHELADAGALIVGEMERVGPKWVFRALGEPVKDGLSEVATNYGIVVAERVQA